MPKTEVLLIHNVIGLGGESDLVKISTGYARNYLIPRTGSAGFFGQQAPG